MDSEQGDSYARNVIRNPAVAKADGSDRDEMGTALANLVSSWKSFDRAGSHFLYQLCSSLAGSQYEMMSQDVVSALGPVFGCRESELVLCHLRNIESLLYGTQAGNQEKNAVSKELMLLRCLLQFVKLQDDYHHKCSTTLSSVINHILSSCDSLDNASLVKELRLLDSAQSISQSPTRALGKKKGHANTGSPRSHKHGFKASLFSLFEKKNSPEESNSSFYVDIGQEGGRAAEVGRAEGLKTGHMMNSNQSQVLVQLGLDPCLSDDTGVQKYDGAGMQKTKDVLPMKFTPDSSHRPQTEQASTNLQKNGEVATQEELDNVINLLSGIGIMSPMTTIPELSQSQCLQVPHSGAGVLSPATSDSGVDERVGIRDKGQRRSEGSIDLSGFGAMPGNNTWPYQHRSSLPGGQLGSSSGHLQYDLPPGFPPGYGIDMRPTTLPPGGAGHFHGAYTWAFPDSKLNRTWPLNNLTAAESVNSNWSGAQDSDDLSDDSSCGDHYAALAQLQNLEHRQDYSRDDSLAGTRKDERMGDVKHHSLEDLLDSRSNTWPQQLQPWPQSTQGLDRYEPQTDTFHRPLQMQLSDPLTHRNYWPGTGEHTGQHMPQSQNVQGLHHM